jgi:hypothetical protein
VILISFFNLDLSEARFAGIDISGAVPGSAALIVFFFLMAHFINCWGEHVSFRLWNSRTDNTDWEKVSQHIHKTTDALGDITSVYTKIKSENFPEDASKDEYDKLLNSVQTAEECLKDVTGGIASWNMTAAITFYLWLAAVPLLLGIFAIYLAVFKLSFENTCLCFPH